jgi:YidC/Oxa1 family membrane protein insertase
MPDPGKKELSMETRLILAFLLMGAVLFLTPLIYKQPGPTRTGAPPKPATQSARPAPPPAKPAEAPPRAAAAARAVSATIAAPSEVPYVIETDLYRIVFSNRGAVVTSWTLKKYNDQKGGPLELVNPLAAPKIGYPLSVIFENQKPAFNLDQMLFVAKPATDGIGVDFNSFPEGQLPIAGKLQRNAQQYSAAALPVMAGRFRRPGGSRIGDTPARRVLRRGEQQALGE